MSTSVEQRYKLYQERQQQQEKEPPTSIEQRYQAYLEKNPSRVEPREEVGPTWLEKNLDVPLGALGSIGGAGLGFALGGPPGAIVGGIAAGALGTGAGTVISETQFKEADEVDAYTKAVENALWSMGFDLATLGVASKVKPLYYAARAKMGKSAEETAKEIIDGAYGPGSRESLQASQAILQQGGATLLPSQVGGAGLDAFKERVASVGLISRQTMAENQQAVNRVVREELTTILNRNAAGFEADPYSMGQAFHLLIEEGQNAVQQTYLKGLDQIKLDLGTGLGQTVDANKILAPINKYLKGKKGVAVDELSPESIQFLNQQLARLENLPNGSFPVHELITLDKAFTQRVSAKFGPEGAERNSVVQAELADVATELRTAIYNAMKDINPDAADAYRGLKQQYADGINTLFPRINKTFMSAANRGSFLGLGNLAAQATNLNQVMAMRDSLKKAFAEASKDPNISLPFESAAQIDELFKRGFLSSRISKIFDEGFLITDLKSVAEKLTIPAESKKFKTILGSDYGRFKQLMNLVVEASESATGDFGVLMLRGAEAGGIRAVAGQVGTLLAGGGAAVGGALPVSPVVMGGVAALWIPQIFANIATNPAYVNRLISLMGKNQSRGLEATSTAAQLLVADVIYSMTDEEKNEMMSYLSNMATQQMGQ